jgi:hypothetical protein
MEALLLVAESGGPTMVTRMGVMRALNHRRPTPKITPRRKALKGLQDRAMKTTEKSEPFAQWSRFIGPRDAPRSWSGSVQPYTLKPRGGTVFLFLQASKMGSCRADQAIAVSISLNRRNRRLHHPFARL